MDDYFAGFAADSIILPSNSIHNMMEKGEDYSNWTALNIEIRKTRAIGCSGKISITWGLNDRKTYRYNVWNAKKRVKDGPV